MPPDAAPPPSVVGEAVPVPDYQGFWCTELNDELAQALIVRTLDSDDLRLREMTRDLARFSSEGQLTQWQPGRDLLCLQDDAGTLLGVAWLADKPLPQRDDYRNPELMREQNPRVTCAIRTYGRARGRGLLTKAFARYALEELLSRRTKKPAAIWCEMKANNVWARALARQMGFREVSQEAGGTVVGIRLAK